MMPLEGASVSIGLFIAATLIVGFGAYWFMKSLHIQGAVGQFAAWWVLGFAQIIVSLLAAGVFLEMLVPSVVLLLNAGITAVAGILYYRIGDREKAVNRLWWSALLREILHAPAWLALILITAWALGWSVYLICLLPANDWDGLFYHLVSPAYWMQERQITITPFAIWTNVYPQNAHLIYTWLVLFLRDDIIVDAGQFLFAIAGAASVAGITRSFGASRAGAAGAACLFLTTPIVLAQLTADYVDTALASMFLVAFWFVLRFIRSRHRGDLLLSGIAGGIALGIKSSALACVGVTGLILFIWCVWEVFGKRMSVKQAALLHLLMVMPIVLLGSFWYIRTWLTYGNPLHPFRIDVLGYPLFPGQGTVHDMIMVPNTPPELLGLPWWEQIWLAWMQPVQPVVYSQHLGGFGLQWPVFLFPALVLFTVLAAWKRQRAFLFLCLPLIVIFVTQPAAWWSRYTISFVALGAASFVLLSEKLKRWAAVLLQGALVAVVAVSVFYQHQAYSPELLQQAASLPREERTFGRLFNPDYAFIDKVPDGTRFAIKFGDFAYPFFGNRFQHTVYQLRMQSENEFWQFLDEKRIDYVFTVKNTPYDMWAQSRPQECVPEGTMERYRLYRIDRERMDGIASAN